MGIFFLFLTVSLKIGIQFLLTLKKNDLFVGFFMVRKIKKRNKKSYDVKTVWICMYYRACVVIR